jgi:hypothetical protein
MVSRHIFPRLMGPTRLCVLVFFPLIQQDVLDNYGCGKAENCARWPLAYSENHST